MPQLGGIGAGIATAITYYILLAIFLYIILTGRQFADLHLFKYNFSFASVKEYLSIGVPNGLGIFMEASLFGFIIILSANSGRTTSPHIRRP